jgi:hypothetical protein
MTFVDNLAKWIREKDPIPESFHEISEEVYDLAFQISCFEEKLNNLEQKIEEEIGKEHHAVT